MQASNQHSRDSLYADVRYNAFITKCHFSATAAPRCVHAVQYLLVSAECILVNFTLFFSPFIFQLHFFFPSIFSLPFSLLIIGEAIFLLVLSVHVFFEWNILEKYKALIYFRNFFSQLNHSQPFIF